ncbi:MAG: hypothetical protein K8R85_16645 [Bacteroidetes bacterium]|nr:hypothetical protein [Bacteroidota bacterium]
MKKIVLFCFAICMVFSVFSQDNVSIYYGQSQTKFKYKNSEGNSDLDFRTQLRSSYGINYSKVFNSGFLLRPGIGLNNLGAVSDLYAKKINWSLHYVDFNFGVGYIKRFGVIAPFIGVSPYVSYLYNATQTVGNDEYDLLADKAIKKNDYGINVFGGVKYLFTEAVAVYAEVKTTTGLMQLEPNSGSGKNQKLYNRAVTFQFGVSFNMVNKKRSRIRSNF